MTITDAPAIREECLTVRGKVVLTNVPATVVVSPASDESAFLGATSPSPSSYHVFSLGMLELQRAQVYMSLQIQNLVDDTILGKFGTPGDPDIQTSELLEAVLINSGDKPFKLMRHSIKILEKHKGYFSHIDNKKPPALVDWFGWNTWDAFYTRVSAEGIEDGLRSFAEGGCLPKFLTIDDGWQNAIIDKPKEGESLSEGTKFGGKLVNLEENIKFKGLGPGNSYTNLREFVKFIKDKYGVKYVYVWHALLGYWAGVLPTSEEMKKYDPKYVYPSFSPGNLSRTSCVTLKDMSEKGIGLVEPLKIRDFYEDLHTYLAGCGIDGVKVDFQNILETLGSGNGGRVTLTKKFREALEDSVISVNLAEYLSIGEF